MLDIFVLQMWAGSDMSWANVLLTLVVLGIAAITAPQLVSLLVGAPNRNHNVSIKADGCAPPPTVEQRPAIFEDDLSDLDQVL